MSFKLPFLKNKRTPRVAPEPMDEKLVQGSADDHMDDHMMGEIFDAIEKKDVSKLRSSLNALLMNCFDWSQDDANE